MQDLISWSRATPFRSPMMVCLHVSPRHGAQNGTGDGNTRDATAAFTPKMVRWPLCSRLPPPRSSRSPRAPSATHVTSSDFRLEKSSMIPGFLDNHGWGFGVSVITRRDDIAAVPGRYGWDGGLGTSWYSDPREDMVTILMTMSSFASIHCPLQFNN